MKRLLVIALLALIIVPVIFFAWLLNTEQGLKWSYRQITPHLSDSLSISALSGSLAGPLVFSKVAYKNQGQSFHAEEVTVNWDPWALLQAEIHVLALYIEQLEIVLPLDVAPAEQPQEPLSLPQVSLPLNIRLDNAEINTVSVTRGAQQHGLERVSASVTTQDNTIQIKRINLANQNLSLELRGSLKPTQFYQHDLAVHWKASLPSGATIESRGELTGDLKSTRILQTLQGSLAAQLELELYNLLEQPSWQSMLQLSAIDSKLITADIPPLKGTLKLKASGDTQVARLSGTVNTESVPWGALSAGFELDIQSDMTDNDSYALIIIRRLDGKLAEYPLALQSRLNWKKTGIDLALLQFRSGETELSAEGSLGDKLALRWSIDSNNLGELYAPAGGRLKASGELIGPREAPVLKAIFEGGELSLPDYMVERLDGKLAIDFSRLELADVQLDAETVNVQGILFDSINVSARPDRIRARLNSEVANAQIEFHGTAQADNWQGTLMQLDIDSSDYQNWRLTSPAAVNYSAQTLSTDDLCLLNDSDGEVCARIDGKNDFWKLALNVKNLALSGFGKWMPAELQIDGRVNARADMEYQFKADVLGSVELDLLPGTATYRIKDEQVERFDYRSGRLTIEMLQTGMNADSRLELINEDFFEAQITMPGARLLSFERDAQSLTGKAKLSTRRLDLVDTMIPAIDNLQGTIIANLQVSGTTGSPVVSGNAQLQNASLSLPDLNRSLTQINLDVQGDADRRIVYRGQARSGDGRVSVAGDTLLKAESGWSSNITLDASSFDLSKLLKPWLPDETRIEGFVNAKARLNFHAPDKLAGEIELWSPPGSVSYPLIEGELEKWTYRDARLILTIDQQGISGNATLTLADDNKFDASIFLPRANLISLDRETQVLEGSGKLVFTDLSIIEALVADINQLKGDMTIYASLGGVLSKPTLSLRSEILQASLRIPRLGLTIERINLRGASDERNQFNFQLDAHSGEGTVEIKGSSVLDAASGWPTRLEIKGNNFEVARIPEATVNVSPDLEVKFQERSIEVKGDLLIPFARLEPKDITTAARVSEDVLILDGSTQPRPEWRIKTSVNLILGERVSFFGYGLESKLDGKILIEETSGQITRGTGEVRILEGRYRAYGQRLDVENGRLIFTGGPVTNPGLDISAVRKINQIRAGIQARGTLKKPQLDLFSIPAMGQTDTLSYILLGRPAESASGEDGDMLAKAALALGLAGGDRIARSLRERFGLDEIRLESNDTGDQTSLVLGRYLSPRLYVSYGVGLIDSFNTLNLRYQIADRWQLKTESGQSQGADILFTIER